MVTFVYGLSTFLCLLLIAPRYTGSMRRFCEICLRVKIVAVEIGSTVVFLFLIGWTVVWEIRHLLGK